MFGGLLFKKKGAVESLFRVGLGDAADYEERPAPVAQADVVKEKGKHLVYNVRGRPFIAQAPGAGNRSPQPTRFGAQPADGTSAPVETPRPPRPRSSSPPRSGSKSSSSLKLSRSQIAEEEYAALFRNNLLRSCWKPLLKNEEVQQILTLWERKLVEVMHRWTHPELWIAYRLWKRRTWDLERLLFILQRARNSKERKAFGQWLAVWNRMKRFSLNPRRRRTLSVALHRWHRLSLLSKSIHSFRYKASFIRFKYRVFSAILEREGTERCTAGFSSRTRGMLRAFNKWKERRERRQRVLQMLRRAVSQWQLRTVQRAMRSWTGKLPMWYKAKTVGSRFLHATKFSMFRRWSTEYMGLLGRIRAAVRHWHSAGLGKALNKWKATTLLRLLAIRSLRRLTRQRELKGFNSWAHLRAQRAAWRLRVGGILGTLRGSKLRRSYNSWADAVGHRCNGELSARRGLSHWTNKELSAAFRSWSGTSSLLTRLYVALASLRHRELRAAFNSADEHTLIRGEMLRRLEGALDELRGRGRRKAWHTWRAEAERLETMRAAMATVLMQRERRALSSWMERMEELDAEQLLKAQTLNRMLGGKHAFACFKREAQLTRTLRRGAGGFRRRPLRSCLSTWQQRATVRAKMQRQMRSAAMEFLGKGCRSAWHVLEVYAWERRRLAGIGMRLARSSESRAWNAWREWHEGRVERQRKIRRGVSSLSAGGRASRRAFNSWAAANELMRTLRFASSAVSRHPLRRGLNSWLHSASEARHRAALLARGVAAFSPAHRAWVTWVARPAHKSAAARALAHLRNRSLSKSWNRWVEEATLLACKAMAMRRLMSRRLLRGLGTWAEVLDDGLGQREQLVRSGLQLRASRGLLKAFNSWRELLHTRRLMRRAAASFANRAVLHGVNGWRDLLAERQRLQQLLTNATAALRGDKSRLALRSWRARVEEAERLCGYATRWQYPALKGALDLWSFRAEELAIMTLGLQGLRMGKAKLAVNSWRAWTAERLLARAKIVRALAHLFGQSCAKAWGSWRASISVPDPMLRAAHFLFYRLLPRAWNKWLGVYEKRQLLLRAAARVVKSPSSRALTSWRLRASERRSKLAKIEATLYAVSPAGRAMRKALNSWRSQLEVHTMMRRGLAALFHRKAMSAMLTWADVVDGRKARRARTEAALTRLSPRGRAMSKALNTMFAAKEMHRMMLRATSGFRSAGSRKAFGSWHGGAQRRLEIETGLRRALSSRLLRALRTWAAAPGSGSPMRASAARMISGPLSRGFTHWAVVIAEVNYRRKALVHLANRGLSKAWRSWLELADARALMSRGLRAMLATELKRGVSTWYAFADARLAHMERMERAVVRMAGDARVRGFNAWVHFWRTPDPRERALIFFVAREMSRAFASWVEEAVRWLLLRKALTGLLARERRRGLNAWRWRVEERRRHTASMAASAKKLSADGRAMTRCLNQLRHVAHKSAPLKTALMRLSNRQQVKAVGTWRCRADETRRRRRLASSLSCGPQVRAMRTWRSFSARAKARLIRLEAEARRLLSGPSVKALNKWKAQASKWSLMRRATIGVMGGHLFRGFRSWHLHWRESKEARSRLAAQVHRFSLEGRVMLKGLNSWRGQAEWRRKKRSALAAILSKGRKQAVNTWREQAAARMERALQLQSALRRLAPEGRAKSRALNQLRGFLRAYHTFRRAAFGVRHRRTRRALNNWHFVVEQGFRIAETLASIKHARLRKAVRAWKQAPPHPARKTLARLTNRELSRCLNAWVGRYEALRDQQRAVAHFVHLGEARALRAWVAHADRLRLMYAGLSAMVQTELRRGLSSWVGYYDERAQQLEMLEVAAARLAGDSMSRGLLTWMTNTLDRPANPMAKALGHMANRRCSKGWRAWQSYLLHRQLQARALGGLLHSGQKRGLNHWRGWYAERLEWRARASSTVASLTSGTRKAVNRWRELATLHAAARVAVRRLRRRREVHALNAWWRRYEEAQLMRRAAGAVLHGPASRAMGAWKELCQRRARDQQLRRRVLLKTTPTARAFGSWVQLAQGTNPARRALLHWSLMQQVKFLRALEEVCEAKAMMRRGLVALFHRKALSGLNTWRELAQMRKAKQAVLAAAVHRLSPLGRAKGRALNMWKRRLELHRLMRRGASAMLNASATRALNRWRASTAAALAAAALMLRAVNRVLLHAFNGWVASRLKPTPVLTKAKRRLVKDPVSVAFDTWWACLDGLRLKRRAAAHMCNRGCGIAFRSWEAHAEMRYMMAAAGSRMLGTLLTRGLNTWVAYADARAEQEALIASTLMSLRSPMRQALNSWAELLEAKGLRERALLRLLNARVSRGWNAWDALLRRNERRKRALAHLCGQAWVRAWHSWEHHVSNRRMMRRAGGVLIHRATHRAVGAWRAAATARAAQRERMRSVGRSLSSRSRAALNSWKGMVEERRLARVALGRFCKQGLSRGLGSWTAFARERSQKRAMMRAALHGMASGLRKAVNRWTHMVEERRLARKAVGPMRHRAKKRALNKMVSHLEETLMRAQKVHTFRATMSSGLRKAINTWRAAWLGRYPAKRAVAHWRSGSLARGWYSWCEHLVVLLKKQTALNHLLYGGQARGLRTWKGMVEDRQRMRLALARLFHREKARALRRWHGSAEWKENMLRVMRGKLLIMAGDHRCLKALNSWRVMVEYRRLMLTGLASVLHRQVRRAFNRLYDRVVRAELVKRKVAAALVSRGGRALRAWVAACEQADRRATALGHWRNAAPGRALNRWKDSAKAMAVRRRGLGLWLNTSLVRGLNSWGAYMDAMQLLRRAAAAWAHSAVRRGLNTLQLRRAERREWKRRVGGALLVMAGSNTKRALNSWRRVLERAAPLRRGVQLWRFGPQSRALRQLRAYAARRMSLRGKLTRLRLKRVGACLNTWLDTCNGVNRKRGLGRRVFLKPQRRALNSWGSWYAQRRRINSLVHTIRAPRSKRALLKWRSETVCRNAPPPPPRSPVSPASKRFIKSMTWREVCSWLTLIGIPVSRSPPTLLRSLKEGDIYIELVHRIALAAHSPYYVRHNVAKCKETCGVYMMIQHFFDSELVIACVGCQKIDVMALRDGKAREHLDLVETFKTILTAVRQAANPHVYAVEE